MFDLIWRFALAMGLMFMGYDLSRAQSASPPPQALFAQHCAACHGAQRQGQMGPALLPESLERLRQGDARDVILKGRAATQMPAFGEQLSPAEVDQLVQWIYTPSSPRPTWSEADIRASRSELADVRKLPARPSWKADQLNLFVVVEGGDHHVSIVDGDRFELIHRFASRFALHGGPKFSPDGRFVYFGSRDGWITKYDLYNLRVVAEVRAGLNMRNVAVSGDGRWVLAGNYLPHTVALFDSDLQLVRTITAGLLDGRATSRVSAVYDAAPRQSFIVALKDIPELWEISYNPRAEPIHDGYVHDFRMGEAIASPGFLGVRRTPLSEPLDDFFFDPPYRHVIGAARPRPSQDGASAPTAQVINLDARQRIATLPLPGMPHLGSGITFSHQGRTVLATPNLQQGLISVIDLQDWRLIKQIPTPGPGFFMRSHEHSPYAWTDAMMSPQARNTLSVIDKNTLEVIAQVKAPEGRTLAHIEFTRDGRYALASLWEKDGALIVYDARTLKEVKRLPMSKPVGKYNVWNKINRSEGTSH